MKSKSTTDYSQETLSYPIAFAQVREDPHQDLMVIKRYFHDKAPTMLMIASGGDTAAFLAGTGAVSHLTLVDANPAQMALTNLKLLLLHLPVKKRLEILGHAPLKADKRKEFLTSLMSILDIPQEIFGNLDQVAELGIDHAGRYERIFAALRLKLDPYRAQIEQLFTLKDLHEQTQWVDSETLLGKAINQAFDEVMSQENLVKIFGEKATANRIQEFSKHFAQQTRHYLKNHLAAKSPFLAQMLLGHFHNGTHYPWLDLTHPEKLNKIEYFTGMMHEYLQTSAPEKFDVVHLSNIIDWLNPEEARATLSLAFKALKPGGVVLIRQLNSNVDIPTLGPQFKWNVKESKVLNDLDRSFFYRHFFLGIKPDVCVAPRVTKMADEILQEIPVIKGKFFKNLQSGTMTLDQFRKNQEQFFYAVDYFSRPMAALISRLPTHAERIDILENIVEEHGDFDSARYHSNTFKQFLRSIGVNPEGIEKKSILSGVRAFNEDLMNAALQEDPLVAIGCIGIIEYAFSDISTLIAQSVVEKGWVSESELVHYNLHAELDKKHAEEFFAILEPHLADPEKRNKIITGLRKGVFIFNRLYDDLSY